MNKLKLKLYRHFPQLVGKEIKQILMEYRKVEKERYSYWDLNHADVDSTFTKILPYIITEEFFEYIYNKCHFRFSFEYFPEQLKYNKDFIDLLIKYQPNYAFHLADDSMLTDEHLRIVEDYYKKNSYNIYVYKIPEKFKNSEIIFEALLRGFFDTEVTHSPYIYFFDMLELYSHNPKFYRKFIEMFEKNNVTFKYYMYNNLRDKKFWFNKELLNYLVSKDYRIIEGVPIELRDEAYRVIAGMIKEGFFVEREANHDDEFEKLLYNSKIIIDAILSLNDFTDYYKYIRNSSATIFTKKHLEILFKTSEKNNEIIMPLNWGENPDILSIFLSDSGSILFTYENINQFKKNAYDEKNIKYIVDNFEEFLETETIAGLFAQKLFENNFFVKSFLNKCKNKILTVSYLECKKLFFYMSAFNLEAFDEESMEIFKDIIVSLDEQQALNDFNFPVFVYSSPEIFKFFLERGYENFYDHFNSLVYDSAEIINLYFRKVDYDKFVSQPSINTNFNKVLSEIKISSIDEFQNFFNILQTNYNLSFAILIVKKYRDSEINDDSLNHLCDYYLTKVKEDLAKKYGNRNISDLLIERILTGDRNTFTLNFINSLSSLYIASNYADILSSGDAEKIIPSCMFLYENVNKKHLNEIINLLKPLSSGNDFEVFDLAIKMYLSVGFNRSRDLLNPNEHKNYGPINFDIIKRIFSKVSLNDILLVQQGKGFVPEENKILLNLLFGSSYKDKSSPLYHYLTNFHDKEVELNKNINEIKLNVSLSEEDKKIQIDRLNSSFNNFKEQIRKFVNDFGEVFNQWDIIEEEFYKAQNKSKLSLKLNVAYINSCLKTIEGRRNSPKLELRDELLANSDVFDYVGRDTQYTAEPATAPARAVTLSRRMDEVTKKKFPNIKLEQNGYTLFVYGPQDRRIISAGFRSQCCFRPNGNADNDGKDNSLLNYCVSTEYGGGVEIRNEKGVTVMFSPLLRNGNVLMIHSIESRFSANFNTMKNVHELLVEFSKKTIEESYRHNDNIDFVTITDLHYLMPEYHKGALPFEKKFRIFNENKQFDKMYNNLSSSHMLLASAEGKTFDDIVYGAVEYSYDYPDVKNEYYFNSQFTLEEKKMIFELLKLNNEIVLKSNERFQAKQNNDFQLANDLLIEIKNLKKEYLLSYKKILGIRKNVDIFEQYKKATSLIDSINEQLGINVDYDIAEVSYGLDWYIIITVDNKIIANCLPSGANRLKKYLNDLKTMRPSLNEEVPSEEITSSYRI